MTTQTVSGDFFVGEQLGPYCGEIATVTAVSATEVTILLAGEETTFQFPPALHLPQKAAPVKESFFKRVARFFS